MTSPNFIANGTIQVSRFVVVDATIDNAVVTATGTTTEIIGISAEWPKYAPLPNATTEAADAGDPVKVFGLGEICNLQSTTAGWTSGDLLTSNATGQGVTASGTNCYGAKALSTMTTAGLGRVQVILGKNP